MNRLFRAILPALLVLATSSHSTLAAVAKGSTVGAKVDLVGSRVKASIGPQWIDVEEDAELQVAPNAGEKSKDWLVEGSLTLPPHALITGCLQWRGDTLLMGKLRGKAKAIDTFAIISSDTARWTSDPMLIEKKSESVYTLKLFPVAASGSRKIRIRYLVPVTSRTGEVSVLPLLSQVDGILPADWSLELRGKTSNLKMIQDGKIWAISPPAAAVLPFTPSGTLALSWGGNSVVGAPRAVVDHVTGGRWAGDFVLFTGKIPDSIALVAGIRSETVVLWRWIRPESFVSTCYGTDPATGGAASFRCLSEYGDLALAQAKRLSYLADYLAGTGNKVGLVADQGMDEAPQVFPVGDSASAPFRKLKSWLAGVNSDYLKWRIPPATGVQGNGANLELSRNQVRFGTDVTLAGTLYSKISGIVRHLLVVTVGPVPSGGDLREPADASGLPSDVSVSSSSLSGDLQRYDAATGLYESNGFLPGSWPGVDLVELEYGRQGTQIVKDEMLGVRIPKVRNAVSATISIGGPAGDIPVFAEISKGNDGNWLASVNVHAASLGRVLKWSLNDEASGTIASWESTPAWVELVDDSVAPRLWAVSELHTSTVFKGPGSLAPDFGFVDSRFSLLALPGDTLGRNARMGLVDSGVPFLGAGDIFARLGYKDEVPLVGVGPHSRARSSALRLTLVASRRVVLVDYAGLAPTGLDIFDLNGRVVARWSASQLVGRTAVEWSGRDLTGAKVARGLFLVRLSTAEGIRSGSVALP